MLTLIIGAGIGFLIAAGAVIGQDRAAVGAWREIARQRRMLHETRRHLDELADDLTEESTRLQEWEARLIVAAERRLQRDEGGTRP